MDRLRLPSQRVIAPRKEEPGQESKLESLVYVHSVTSIVDKSIAQPGGFDNAQIAKKKSIEVLWDFAWSQ